MSRIDGTTGNDEIDGSFEPDEIHGDNGDDKLYGHGGDDELFGDLGDDLLAGGDGNDTLTGGDGADTMAGGADADYIHGGGGDVVDGGSGGNDDDTLSVTNVDCLKDLVPDSDGDGYHGTIVFEDGSTLSFISIENLVIDGVAVEWPDYIVEGTDTDDLIDADYDGDPEGDMIDDMDNQDCDDDDLVEAYDGNDTVLSGLGQDTVHAGTGDDVVDGGAGDDTIYGGAGQDLLVGDEGNDSIDGGADGDSILGWTGDDTLSGDSGDDSLFGGHGADSISGGDGLDQIEGGDGDDIIAGDAGDDVIEAGAGHDEVSAGDDDDYVFGDAGNDTVQGDDGSDTVYGGTGDDDIDLGAGDDTGIGGEGGDTIAGGAGDDALFGDEPLSVTLNGAAAQGTGAGGVQADNVTDFPTETLTLEMQFSGPMMGTPGPDDPALLTTMFGYGTPDEPFEFALIAQSDNEVYDLSTPDDPDDTIVETGYLTVVVNGVGYPTGIESNTLIDGAAQTLAVTVDTANQTVEIYIGGQLAETVALDNDTALQAGGSLALGHPYPGTGGFSGDITEARLWDDVRSPFDINQFHDIPLGDEAADTGLVSNWLPDPFTGGFSDHIGSNPMSSNGATQFNTTAGSGDDSLSGGDGADTVVGAGGDDTLAGDAGDDLIIGGTGADDIMGGTGNDTISAIDSDNGADTIDAGDDRDVIHAGMNDSVDGGAGGDDFDVLDLSGSTSDGGSLKVTITGTDSNDNGFDGYVEYFDASGALEGTLNFEEIESVVPCFTPGTRISTGRGDVAVEDLRIGDFVQTRDHGLQAVEWVGTRDLSAADLVAQPELRPITIAAGALGRGLPLRAMTVSPQHRMLLQGPEIALLFGEDEVLAPATHLTALPGIDIAPVPQVRYIHFMCAAHEIVRAEGTWTETFQPAAASLAGLEGAARDELLTLFPQLARNTGQYPAARATLKRFEAKTYCALHTPTRTAA